MSKKILSLCLALIMALSSMSALAVGVPATQSYSGTDSVYIAESGYIMSGTGKQLSTLEATSILCVSESGVTYIAASLNGMQRLVYEATGKRPSIFASSILDAVYVSSASLVYYVLTTDPYTIYRCTPVYGVATKLCQMDSPISSLQSGGEGLLITTTKGGLDLVWELPTGSVEPELSSTVAEYIFDGCTLRVPDSGFAKLYFTGMNDYSLTVDSSILACAMTGNTLYYTKEILWKNTIQLRCYTTSEAVRTSIAEFDTAICPSIAADENFVFLLKADGQLLAVNTNNGNVTVLARGVLVPDAPYITLINDELFIYNREEGMIPELVEAFVISEIGNDIIADAFISATPTPAPTPKPTPVPTATPYIQIKQGSKGEDVRQMQLALRELGYLTDKADGSFGRNTLRAVKLFQEAVGMKETGIADFAMLEELYSDNAPVYDPYRPLSRGCNGVRVVDLQTQLYNHGYLAYPADGSYGANTQDAVKRLQEELGYNQSGNMNAALMKYVYNGKMPDYSGYIPLTAGASGIRVEQLQRRLKLLGYYGGKISGEYDYYTKEAVKLFERQLGAKETGKATVTMQKYLFAQNAPAYIPDTTSAPTAKPKPTQAPTTKPTAKPTAKPTGAPSSYVVDGNSSYSEILHLQQMLNVIGKLDSSRVTGKYNSETKYAVGYIQKDLRDNKGYDVHPTGYCDQTTYDWITNQFNKKGGEIIIDITPEPVVTPKPTAKPTEAPDPTKAPASDYISQNDIKAFAKLLNEYLSTTTLGFKELTPKQSVEYLQLVMQKWGYYPEDHIATTVYDEQLFNLVSVLRDDLSHYDKSLIMTDTTKAGKVGVTMFNYIIMMIENEPTEVDASFPIQFKIW